MTGMKESKPALPCGEKSGGISLSVLVGILLSLFAVDNVLLLQFLGLSPLATAALILLVVPLAAFASAMPVTSGIRVPWTAIAVAGIIAAALFILGGQGRLFYANADWQVRDAILADMARYPWPFAYLIDGKAALLRAPLGLYLLPSLAGKGFHEWAMLLSNTLRLTLLLALCWPMFVRNRDRWIAITVFLFFSGLDIVGTAFVGWLGGDVSWDHLERWNFNQQFSAHITQAFWVPQHALAGWACAATYLLWQKGLARIGLFAATIPLVAIWSPLAIMGAVPFALFAGISVLRSGDWTWRDVVLTGASVALSLPSLIYLQFDAAQLSSGLRVIGVLPFILLMILEVLPFVLPPLFSRQMAATDKSTLWIILGCLFVMPLFQIGANTDFQMRASIMPLALLALLFAQWLIQRIDQRATARGVLGYALVLLLIGAATPVFEIARAVRLDPSPTPRCSMVGIWSKQQGLIVAPHATYFARSETLPTWMQSVPAVAGRNDPERCWSHKWGAE
jgi:hypothetical protein